MALSCQGLITRNLHPSRFIPGRFGYTGAPIPAAIVLHQLRNISYDAYSDQLCSPLPKFLCEADPLLCTYPYSTNPKGVHFSVNSTGFSQYAELTDQTLGLDYIDVNSWGGLAALLPITSVNGPFIHVAIDGDVADHLVTLLCCIGVDLERSLPILTAGDLQSDRPQFSLNPTLQTQVDDCVASGGFINPPNVFDLAERVDALELCCINNSSDIILLREDLTQTNIRLATVESKVTVLEEKVADIYDKIAVIPNLVAQVTTLINQVTDILNRCCPKAPEAVCAQYQLLPGDEMLVPPNQAIWVNLPTRIEDRDDPNCTTGCQGPIVKPGPLWMACLEDCTWNIEATVRFRLAQWCAGKYARMYLVACGVQYLIAEQIITSTATQAVTLTGNFLLPAPGCCDVHLLVKTNDDKITTAKVIEFANFRACCV